MLSLKTLKAQDLKGILLLIASPQIQLILEYNVNSERGHTQ